MLDNILHVKFILLKSVLYFEWMISKNLIPGELFDKRTVHKLVRNIKLPPLRFTIFGYYYGPGLFWFCVYSIIIFGSLLTTICVYVSLRYIFDAEKRMIRNGLSRIGIKWLEYCSYTKEKWLKAREIISNPDNQFNDWQNNRWIGLISLCNAELLNFLIVYMSSRLFDTAVKADTDTRFTYLNWC